MSINDLRKNDMMRHLLDALERGEDIGHYGRLVFAMVARHFMDEDELVRWLCKDEKFSDEEAGALCQQVKSRGYNPPPARADPAMAVAAAIPDLPPWSRSGLLQRVQRSEIPRRRLSAHRGVSRAESGSRVTLTRARRFDRLGGLFWPIRRWMPDLRPAPEISIVVPTLNEAPNISELVSRIDVALRGRPYEVLFIDDGSTDGTREMVSDLSERFPVRLYLRDNASDGLSGAVVWGLSQARGHYLVVMDGDLQHPPQRIGDLLDPLEHNDADFVLGSRYVRGGSTESQWGRLRRLNSHIATALARPFARGIRDPMSGFFALRRETFAAARDLNPVGYKVALELMCKCQVERVVEVPIEFGLRGAGASKLTLRQQVRYLDHLSRLYDFCFPAASPHVKFALATACAWLIAFGLYVRLVAGDVNPVFAPTLAFAGAILPAGLFQVRSLRSHPRKRSNLRAWTDFAILALGEWAVCMLTARWVAYHVLRASVLEVFFMAFGAAAVARYVLRRRITGNLRGVRAELGRPDDRADFQVRRSAA